MKWIKILSVLLSIFLSSCNASGNKKNVTPSILNLDNKIVLRDSLRQTLKKQLKDSKIEGLSIAIIRNSSIMYYDNFGVKNKETNEEIGETTVFEAASLSKPIFAYLTLQLVKEGVLDLDKPLHEYMVYEDIEHDKRYKSITARMVLSHTSGFQNWRRDTPLAIQFMPGSQFSYSGEGYMYLQKVIEKITSEKLSTLINRRVFKPLNMSNSYFKWSDSIISNLATGHDREGLQKKKWKPQYAWAAGSLHTTTLDYSKFLIKIMNDDYFMDMMAESQVNISGYNNTLSWGLGLGLQKNEYGTSFWHWGSNDGYKSFVLGYPKTETAMVYMTNSDHGLDIVDDLSCYIFGGKNFAFDWLKNEHDYPLEHQCDRL